MIKTERLILKPVTMIDFDIYKEIMYCPSMSLCLPKGAPYSDSEILQHVVKRAKHWKQNFGSFIVYLKTNPNVKLGYAYEAAKAVLEHTFGLGKQMKIYGVSAK